MWGKISHFFAPTEIIFGSGSLELIGEVARRRGRRASLFVGRRALVERGIIGRVEELLRREGVEPLPPFRVGREPRIEDVEEGAREIRRSKAEVVIGIGGGSVMDLGKAAAGIATKSAGLREYMRGREFEGEGLPFIAVPTTAGTGAEVTSNAVLIDPQAKTKRSFRSPHLFPKAAIVDPSLTLSLPPEITARTGMDALCQAIESLISKGATPLTIPLSLKAVELVGRNLVEAYRRGEDLLLREKVMCGALLSGLALENAALGIVHGVAHPLGAIYDIPHGLLCGLLLPYAIEFNMSVAAGRLALAAEALGASEGGDERERARKLREKIEEILDALHFPRRLRDLGVRREDFRKVAEDGLSSRSMRSNPRDLSAEEIIEFLESAW